MNDKIYTIARKIRPDLEHLSEQQRIGATADVFTLLYTLPLALLGLVWLAWLTDLSTIGVNFFTLIILACLWFTFNQLSFFIIADFKSGRYANAEGTLEFIAVWTAVFLIGPVGLWLDVFCQLVIYVNRMLRSTNASVRWNQTRNFSLAIAGSLIATLVALHFYQTWGGQFPLPNLHPDAIILAFTTIIVQTLLIYFVYAGLLGYITWAYRGLGPYSARGMISFFMLSLTLPALANPFAILAVGLLVEHGVFLFSFFMVGLLMVAYLTRRLSMVAESSRQQSRQLEALEKLSLAFLAAPPDASTLPQILQDHVPAMFPAKKMVIWGTTTPLLWTYPADTPQPVGALWDWLRGQKQAQIYLTGDHLPWEPNPYRHGAVLVTPILDMESNQPIGGIMLELQRLALPWSRKTVSQLLPAVESLSAQLASEIHHAQIHLETLMAQKTIQELSLARRIQSSFLPQELPLLPGWQISAVLEPARQISGDFYDFIPLADGSLGIVIADVADKGLGPALYMALSRTLIRTFAQQSNDQPGVILNAANKRILLDAHANLFVTVFFGIIHPQSGLLRYANAGHTPPYLLNPRSWDGYTLLKNTGMPLGIEENASWGTESIQLNSGDYLLLYTDGITDAQNEHGEFIDRMLMVNVAQKYPGLSAAELRDKILADIHTYMNGAPQFDDITMVILARD